MKKCYLSIIILLSLNIQAEHIFKANPKGYQGSLVVDPYFTESDFIFKEYNPLPWTELERNLSNFTPLILNQTADFTQNGTATILQERTVQHIYTNTKINTDVIKQTSVEQQTITEPATQNVIVTKTNSLETENKSNCTEWTPATDTKFTDEMVEQTQECDVQTVDTYSYSINGNVFEQKDINGSINKTFEQEVSGTLAYSDSCKSILEANPQFYGNDGVYDAKINNVNSKLYCNMTDHGGGWTLVVAQFESNPVLWNKGVSYDYDPNLGNGLSFALNSSQIPKHTQMSFSHSNYDNKSITNIFNYKYTTGNIDPSNLIFDTLNGIYYQIHRANNHFSNHDPQLSNGGVSTHWDQTLTIDRYIEDGYTSGHDFSFGIHFGTASGRGYAYKGVKYWNDDTGAWLIFVR